MSDVKSRLEMLYFDCALALEDRWDRDDDGFRAMQYNLDKIAELLGFSLEINEEVVKDW